MQLHSIKDVLPDSVSSDFQNLNRVNKQEFCHLTEILFQFLLEPKEVSRFMQQLLDFAGEHGMSAGPLRSLMRSVLLVSQGVQRNSAKVLFVGSNEEKRRFRGWGEHYPALSKQAVGQTLKVNQLVDMEWKFGVTVGTSEVQKAGSIFLQLKLMVRRGNSTQNLYMELTLPQFYHFLHEMERAKANMDSFN
uniref:COMM domain containing 7 n=1 Tax=Nothobranchius furzeri TaxID=105023 RepID=A0A8C6NZV2_NOTFU